MTITINPAAQPSVTTPVTEERVEYIYPFSNGWHRYEEVRDFVGGFKITYYRPPGLAWRRKAEPINNVGQVLNY